MSDEKPLAYEIYQKFADAYSERIETKPHNAYYDRPAVLSMLDDIQGLDVLDAGCGPGVYTSELIKRGANVVACDVSERMLELGQERVGDRAEFKIVDLTQPLSMFEDGQFSVIVAPLCLDYIADWESVFAEFFRILKPGGYFVKSSGHPSFDAEYFKTSNYFSVEQVECVWRGFGNDVLMKSYRRSVQEFFMPLLNVGFQLDQVLEPLPTEEFKAADPIRYERLLHRPGFLCIRASRPLV